jgi:2-polyprenyl-3-methyl-5-hydroxy-6-metoxy-1,4-benzoquinol methylase
MAAGEFNENEVVDACLLCGSSRLTIIDARASITRCDNCSFKFVTPRPTQAAIHHYYNVTGNYDKWLVEHHDRDVLWARRFSIVSRLLSTGSLLDVGAGIGTFLDIAKKNGFDVQGTEVSEKAIGITKKLYSIDLLRGALEDQKFNECSFDVITLWHVLEHVPNPQKTLSECNRILKRKGYLIIAVPNDDSLVYLINKMRGLPRYEPLSMADEIHLSHFTSKSLKHMLSTVDIIEKKSWLDNYLPIQTVRTRLHYAACALMKTITRKNYYSTILSISQKC